MNRPTVHTVTLHHVSQRLTISIPRDHSLRRNKIQTCRGGVHQRRSTVYLLIETESTEEQKELFRETCALSGPILKLDLWVQRTGASFLISGGERDQSTRKVQNIHRLAPTLPIESSRSIDLSGAPRRCSFMKISLVGPWSMSVGERHLVSRVLWEPLLHRGRSQSHRIRFRYAL